MKAKGDGGIADWFGKCLIGGRHRDMKSQEAKECPELRRQRRALSKSVKTITRGKDNAN